jgi:hypothetical protein
MLVVESESSLAWATVSLTNRVTKKGTKMLIFIMLSVYTLLVLMDVIFRRLKQTDNQFSRRCRYWFLVGQDCTEGGLLEGKRYLPSRRVATFKSHMETVVQHEKSVEHLPPYCGFVPTGPPSTKVSCKIQQYRWRISKRRSEVMSTFLRRQWRSERERQVPWSIHADIENCQWWLHN